MRVDLDLIPAGPIRDQIIRKLNGQQSPAKVKMQTPAAPTETKYHNIPTDFNNIKFQSIHEGERYCELMLMCKAGNIRDLRLQVNFTLQEGYTTPKGTRIRPIVYKADFTYYRVEPATGTEKYVVEDAKSRPTKTKTYLLKKKMMQDKFGIEIQEV